ncbi:MAG: DUF1826 domain-containing protein [Pseudomonadota bacterium]|nr:DUF1826 domain-containing protein [Pseudomonadota bacterium]
MTVFEAKGLRDLAAFKHQEEQLAILERQPLGGGDEFFKKLSERPLNVIGIVGKKTSVEEILALLEDEISEDLKSSDFYMQWIIDMAGICNIFCETLATSTIGFCLATQRACQRYHIDNVPLRLLVTYYGRGTEWVPDSAVDRLAYDSGMPNNKILTNNNARKFLNAWDIAIFRGGPDGLLHRTPDAALNRPSILLRLDHESFWDTVFRDTQEGVFSKPL